MKHFDEFSLMECLKSGSMEAFEVLYVAYSKELYVYAFRRLHDVNAVEDILQEVFTSFWEKRTQVDISVSARAYLYQAVRFKIADQYRKDEYVQRYFTDSRISDSVDLQIAERIDSKDQLRSTLSCIEELPVKMQQVFKMSRFDHLSVIEIAQRLQLSTQTVKNQISKALSHLRKRHLGYLENLAMIGLIAFSL